MYLLVDLLVAILEYKCDEGKDFVPFIVIYLVDEQQLLVDELIKRMYYW